MSDGSSKMSKQGASNSKHTDSAGQTCSAPSPDAHRRDTCTEVVKSPSLFVVGRRYWAQSAGDTNCVWWFRVVARSVKTVTIHEDNGGMPGRSVRRGVKCDDQGEWLMPFGVYSLAPVLRAHRVEECGS